ncbi:MAG: putative 4-hydroxybenzoate polyprenyltransferase [Desulfovibrio sp.]|nr:putative 4-hydroxybenzoate polyprenyltransferase [Desulfovibrio sp.]
MRFIEICRMIKIEHSVFALPWAWSGAFLAARGLPSARVLFFLTVAMIGVRSFAMTANRIIDVEIDRRNPRTRERPLATGAISLREALVFAAVAGLVFIAACACLNLTCLILSLPALIFASAYSYTKRYSPLCHYWLGATLGLAPLAGWLAVIPSSLGLAPIALFFAVSFWVGAFDIYYAFQDLTVDRETGLHSIPADLGESSALHIAAFSHCMTVIFLFLAGFAAPLGWPWYSMCAAVGAILLWEHKLVASRDPGRLKMAFFTLNGVVSFVVLAGAIFGVYF